MGTHAAPGAHSREGAAREGETRAEEAVDSELYQKVSTVQYCLFQPERTIRFVLAEGYCSYLYANIVFFPETSSGKEVPLYNFLYLLSVCAH